MLRSAPGPFTYAIALVSLAGAMACGKAEPACSGKTCLPIEGEYAFTLSPAMTCADWQVPTPGAATMAVTRTGSAVEVKLFDASLSPHFLSGSLFTSGAVTLNESGANQELGLPVASMSGAFSQSAPFSFQGSLQLTAGSSAAAGSSGSTSASSGCSASYSLRAVQQASTAPITDTDAGATDGGTTDGGRRDGGSGDTLDGGA